MVTNVVNLIGVDVTRVDASGAATFTKGTRVFANDGSEYIYAVAGSAASAAQAVGINLAGSAVLLTKARADAGDIIAWATATLTLGQYAWFQMTGPTVQIKVKNSCLPAVPLYTTATPGALDDTSASQTRVYGVRLHSTATATASNATRNAIVNTEATV